MATLPTNNTPKMPATIPFGSKPIAPIKVPTALPFGSKPIAPIQAKATPVAPDNSPFAPLKTAFAVPIETGGNILNDWHSRFNDLMDTVSKSSLNFVNPNPDKIEQAKANMGVIPQAVGGVIGGGFDILGEGLKTIVKGFTGVTPQPIKDAVKQGVQQTLKQPQIQAGVQALSKGMDAYNQWKKSDPINAKTLEGIVNIGLLGVGGEAKKVAEPLTESIAKTASETGVKILDSADEAVQGAKEATGKAIKSAKNAVGLGGKSEADMALDAITPNVKQLTPTERQALLEEGKLAPQKGMKTAQVILTPEEKAFAVQHSDLLQGKTSVENYGNIANRVAEEDASIGQYLKDQNSIYNQPKLRETIMQSVSKITKPLLATDTSWKKATNQLVNDFMDSIKGDKTFDLWEARKSFDRNIENAMNAFEGTPTAKKALGNAIRNTAQNFIESTIGDGTYKSAMKDMSGLIRLNETIGNKAIKEMGSTGIQNYLKSHPLQGKAIRTMGGLLRLGGLLEIIK